MDKIFVSPSRYIQGKDLINHSAEYLAHFGKRLLVLADEFVQEIAADQLIESLKNDFEITKVTFGGECSIKEINRVSEIGQNADVETIIGVGAGKTIDAAKAIADKLKIPIVVVPTLASTDAPTSGLSVIYTEEGAFEQYLFYKKNPDLVLMDTKIIAEAPSRMLASGISDAMATLVEARAVQQANGETMSGGKATIAGFAIAEKCEQVLFDYGLQAYAASKEKIVTPALEAIVEANTLLSGLGFEDSGLAAAHAIHNGFTAVEGDIHHLTHGEKVSYGTMTQLVLENRPIDELERYIDFYLKLDLPITLEGIHLDKATDEELYRIGELATAPDETMKNMPFKVTPDDVVQALKAVDVYTKDYQRRCKL
ncbi:glycerol dehydrogenase [Amphibacillus sp. MSJ-3]|uniref:glycerol dehydrogenase n=1 Tax=Amphibacillus sp. MSJ-3 TaxID=2841505 RepID=UPI001C0EC7BB|nr:glycerol dehydrogenase [Amphibacillus sp. MSJ-3]MBU5594515.1 glycerol dehydrogenase [Amphibacillus sp. MSJ-3]